MCLQSIFSNFCILSSADSAMQNYNKVSRREPGIPPPRTVNSSSIPRIHEYVDPNRQRHTKRKYYLFFSQDN